MDEIKARIEVVTTKGIFFTKYAYNVMIRKGNNIPKMYSARGVSVDNFDKGFMLLIDEGISGSSMGATSKGTVSGRVYSRKPKTVYVDAIEWVEKGDSRMLTQNDIKKLRKA